MKLRLTYSVKVRIWKFDLYRVEGQREFDATQMITKLIDVILRTMGYQVPVPVGQLVTGAVSGLSVMDRKLFSLSDCGVSIVVEVV